MTTFVFCNECGNRWKVSDAFVLCLFSSSKFEMVVVVSVCVCGRGGGLNEIGDLSV